MRGGHRVGAGRKPNTPIEEKPRREYIKQHHKTPTTRDLIPDDYISLVMHGPVTVHRAHNIDKEKFDRASQLLKEIGANIDIHIHPALEEVPERRRWGHQRVETWKVLAFVEQCGKQGTTAIDIASKLYLQFAPQPITRPDAEYARRKTELALNTFVREQKVVRRYNIDGHRLYFAKGYEPKISDPAD